MLIKKIFKKTVLLATMLAGMTVIGAGSYASAVPVSKNTMEIAGMMKNAFIEGFGEDTRVFQIDKTIGNKKVHFQNRYGIQVTGDLYLPKDFDASKKYAAIVVSGPFGAVKEQVSGLYAQEMAKRGFIVVAFDPSFTGESGGKVRDVASPDIFTEDFSAAVDFVGLLPYVDRERIGAIGICGLSGPAITAATNDVRIKAVAVSAMYDMTDSIRDHYQGSFYTPEQREVVKKYLADMRWQEAVKGEALRGYHEVPIDNEGKAVRAEKRL